MRPMFRFAVGLWISLYVASFARADIAPIGPPLWPESRVSIVVAGISLALASVLGGLMVIRHAVFKTYVLLCIAFLLGICSCLLGRPPKVIGYLLFALSLVASVVCLVWAIRCHRRLKRTSAPISEETEAVTRADHKTLEVECRESKMIFLASSFLFLSLLVCIIDPNIPRPRKVRIVAQVCVERAAAVLTNAQIDLQVDPKMSELAASEAGEAMIVCDKRLTKEVLAGIGKEIVPVGQLWLEDMTLVVNGKPVATDKTRTIAVEDNAQPMMLFLLGVRKGDNNLELVVYGKDTEPLQVVPLTNLNEISYLPLQLKWRKLGKLESQEFHILAVGILGKYEGLLQIARTER